MKRMKRERKWLEGHLLQYIVENNIGLSIHKISYSPDHQIKQARELQHEASKIYDHRKTDKYKREIELLADILDYIHGAIFEDDITNPNDDNVRDNLENGLNPRCTKRLKKPSKRELKRLGRLSSYYSNSQLKRNKIVGICCTYDYYISEFPEASYSKETKRLASILKKDTSPVSIRRRVQKGVGPRGGKIYETWDLTTTRYEYLSLKNKKIVVENVREFCLLLVEDLINHFKAIEV
jgi:hypothetical protein